MSVTESESEVAIDIQLSACGWLLDPRKPKRNVYKQQARTKEQNEKLKLRRPDYVLYAFEDSDKPTAIIEAKKPNRSLSDALRDGIEKYAKKINASIVIVSDGWRMKSWHIERNEPLFLDGRELDELCSPAMMKQFVTDNKFSSFSENIAMTQVELIRKFKKANTILKNEGFSAGIERFSEFANLMFLKLQTEGGQQLAGFSWTELEAKHGKVLLEAVKTMFKHIKKDQLFEQTKITNPKNMERLIEILSSVRLSSVKADIKGIAFENFIHSYTRGTKNDLGQYFTPRHIVKMMVHFLKPEIGETVYDPFCGTGGMLIECFRYINQHIKDAGDKRFLKKSTLFGRDNSSVSRIAIMNMIMFGDGHSNIQQGDSYASLDETKHKYDVVITNIPFSQQTDFYEGYPVMPSGSKNGDSIAVQHCLESLKEKETARAAIIVPVGFLYKKELSKERKHIFDKWTLERIIELSPKCFQPYTEQQTAVLIINKTARKKTYDYHRIKNDGYSQDGYRVSLPGENDIDKAMDGKAKTTFQVNAEEYSRFKTITHTIKRNEVRLAEIANIVNGASNISPKTKIGDIHNGTHPIMMVADLAEKHIDYFLTGSSYKLTDKAVTDKKPHKFPKYTTLIPTTGKASLKNHRGLLGIDAYATSTLTGIESKDGKIHPFCLFYFFLHFDVEDIVYDLGYPGISPKTIADIPFPNYSDKQQQDIIHRIGDAVEKTKQLKKLHEGIIND